MLVFKYRSELMAVFIRKDKKKRKALAVFSLLLLMGLWHEFC